MGRARGWIVAASFGALCGCSLIVGTSGLSGSATGGGGGDASLETSTAADGAAGPLAASCRALHATSPDAGSGTYQLAGDGGVAVNADCDMTSFGGGWTRVTPAMIVEDKAVQDYAPDSPAHVDVARGTDVQGGVFFAARITVVNCGTANMKAGPGHYFMVGELDHWTQIMATYAFSDSSSCWNIFGDPKRDTNVRPFSLAEDLIGPQLNMSRSAAGAAIPYDGRTTACDEDADNFWGSPYESDPKSARVVLRRFSQDKPAGLAVNTDCGLAGWKVSDIHVR
jgi:hypothetical protein